jgi:hypothetical protein
MARAWNARGDTASNIIVWFAAITAALIIAVWFVRNNPFTAMKTASQVDEDLYQVRKSLGNACNADTYYARYNPLSTGSLLLLDNMLCINQTAGRTSISRCSTLLCRTGISSKIDLDGITYIIVSRNGSIGVSYEI